MKRKCYGCGSRETTQVHQDGLWQCLGRHAEDVRKGLSKTSPFFDKSGVVEIQAALRRIAGRPPTKEQTS